MNASRREFVRGSAAFLSTVLAGALKAGNPSRPDICTVFREAKFDGRVPIVFAPANYAGHILEVEAV